MAPRRPNLGTVRWYSRQQSLAPVSVPKRQKTYVAIILDSSGSMGSIKQQAIDHYNKTIQTIQEQAKNQDVLVSLVTFGLRGPESIKTVEWNVPVDRVTPLNHTTYTPLGWTQLYQAIGETAERIETEATDLAEDNVAVLINVITDGMENMSSGKYAISANLRDLIQRLQKTGKWTFAVQGANFDINTLVRNLGLEVGNVQSFTATAAGTRSATLSNASSHATYFGARERGATSSANFYTNKTDP